MASSSLVSIASLFECSLILTSVYNVICVYCNIIIAASDWTLGEASLPLSVILGTFGICATLLGKWQIKAGPRKSMALSSVVFGAGVALGGLGIQLHSLPLLYFGYGVLAGVGTALAYTPPVQTLMQWFPDRKGMLLQTV